MKGTDYQECCHAAAQEAEAGNFCPECQRPLYRCINHPRCLALAQPGDYCHHCVQPEISLAPDATIQAKAGDVLSIPLRLRNASSTGRALLILDILQQQAEHEQVSISPGWNRLAPGQERGFTVVTQPLEHGGTQRVQVTVLVGVQADELQEKYAFGTELVLSVDGNQASQIVQNIHFDNSDLGTGAMVVANPQARTESSRDARREDAPPLQLERLEKYELDAGLRGYPATGLRVLRHVDLAFDGFPEEDTPPPWAWMRPRPILRWGRNSRRHDMQNNPEPNDVCLRAYHPDSGEMDRETSLSISRRTWDLLLENDRLGLRALSGSVVHNGEVLPKGSLISLEDGDRLEFALTRNSFDVLIRFQTSHEEVTGIRFERMPSVPLSASTSTPTSA